MTPTTIITIEKIVLNYNWDNENVSPKSYIYTQSLLHFLKQKRSKKKKTGHIFLLCLLHFFLI